MKYPRTFHFPWSPGKTNDDKVQKNLSVLKGASEVVATEKFDGENFTLTAKDCHARSETYSRHGSRDMVRSLWGRIRHEIPADLRIHGENIYAVHSIEYAACPQDYFSVFGMTDAKRNVFLSWEETEAYAEMLGLSIVPVLYRGVFDEEAIKACFTGTSAIGGQQEGYVCRVAGEFAVTDFRSHVAKFVRANHVQSSQHWMHQEIKVNGKA